MSLPKIAEALVPRAISQHKMWFNPLAPVPAAAVADLPATPSAVEPAGNPTETAPTKGAPIKEAEAIVPKLELSKAVVPSPQPQTSSISHNL